MPRVKCIPSLRESCIQFVVRNIDVWCQQSTSDLLSIGPKIGNNPFDELPRVILEEIIRFYQRTTKPMKNGNKVLQHLMTPRLVRVLLPCDQELLEMALVRCPQLKNLELFHGNLKSFPKFEKLEKLSLFQDLQYENENGLLHAIGTCCTNLREFDISNCSGVTDRGIEVLCLGLINNPDRKKIETEERCKSLQVLKVGNRIGQKITKKGIKIALENLPALRIIDHDATVEVLADIAQTNSNQMLPKFALSVLRVEFRTPYSSGNLGLAISLCPSVTSVHIEEMAGITNRDLFSLMALKKLKQLHIHGNLKLEHNHEKITFNGSLVPLLKVIGRSLENLELLCLSDVNVHIIAELCPNLSRLFLENILSYTVPCPDEVNTTLMSKRSHTNFKLKSLTYLYISVLECQKSANNHPSREILLLLLSSPFLSEIEIRGVNTLTDNVLLSASKVHHFEKLIEIYLQLCDFVSKRGIDVFMENNSLEAIYLYNCEKVTKENITFWENQTQKKNWDLYIDSELCL